MELKNAVIFGGVAAVLLIIGGTVMRPEITVNVPEEEMTPVGAVSSLDAVDNPSVSIAGYQEYWFTVPLQATSSVVARLQNPFNATSTIERAVVIIENGIKGNNLFTISTTSNQTSGTGVNGYGSSTPALVYNFDVQPSTSARIDWAPYSTTTKPTLTN